MARGEFALAQRDAEAALSARPPRAARTTALLLAADAATAQGLHAIAARHYGELAATLAPGPAAATATMGLAWAELRQGDRERASRTWVRFADTFPSDPQAPLALALAGEVASETGQLAAAQDLFDRLIARHVGTPEAEASRLGRAIVLLRRDRDDDAVRDLDALVHGVGTAAIRERRQLIASLQAPVTDGALAALPVATASNGRPEAQGGDPLERFADSFLETGDLAAAPYVLHGLVVLGASRRGWTDPVVGTLATRLLDEFPTYPPAPVLLARVGASALAAGRWPIVRQAYGALATRDPAGVFARSVRVDLAEALLRTDAPAEARRHLADVATDDREGARALRLRAEASEALGDRRAAVADYDRLQAEHPAAPRSPQSLLAHARLLDEAGERPRARPLLERAAAQARGETIAEAAYRLATILADAHEHQAAVEWYLTAAYVVAEPSRWARPALLGAGASLAALNETGEALAMYRRLVPARAAPGRPEDRALSGEAAYRAAELVSRAGRHEEALDLYFTSAHLTAGAPAERRALVGAVRCLVAVGDRTAAEVIYHRLLESSATEPEHLARARQALRAAGPSPAR